MNFKRIALIALGLIVVGAISALAYNSSLLQGRLINRSSISSVSKEYINTPWYKFNNIRTGLYDLASVVTSPVTSIVTSKVTSGVTDRGGNTSKVASTVVSTSTTPVASIVVVPKILIDNFPCKFSPNCNPPKILELPEIWQTMLRSLEIQDYRNNRAKYTLSRGQRENLILLYKQQNNIK